MSFDLPAVASCVARHGAVVRVVVAEVRGSAPREAGASMLVWSGGQSCTIGGGALEFQAAAMARGMLDAGEDRMARAMPLGPGLGQCCGGAVTLLFERFTAQNLPQTFPFARPVMTSGPMPAAVQRIVQEAPQGPVMLKNWLIEPQTVPQQTLWVHGAGHVGRALVAVMAPLPGFAVTWVDTASDRFPDAVPEGVNILVAADPAIAVAHAPRDAAHLIVTYSHELDLELCHAILRHGFGFCGLIGSNTKWARFRSRLRALGHSDAESSKITCPIGDPALGKHPQAIALGVASMLLGLQMRASRPTLQTRNGVAL